jgi:hypothetical protein
MHGPGQGSRARTDESITASDQENSTASHNASGTRNDQTCRHWTDGRYCAATPARLYIVGQRCPDHTPARLAGRQEPRTPAERETQQALVIARAMAKAGIPIFTANAASNPDNDLGFYLPKGWQQTRPNVHHIDYWKPGMALCAVGGVVADFVDVDPRNGGDMPADRLKAKGHWPNSYGRACTPSGGTHDLIAPLGIRKAKREGIDYQGGDKNGQGRGFVFIAPTVRPSKVTGEHLPYRWEAEPDLEALLNGDDTGVQFKEWVSEETQKPLGNGYESPNGKPSANALAGILRKMATEKGGNRQSLGYWAAGVLLDNGYPPEAWDALERAMRYSGASNHDVRTALRDRPDGRVMA